MLTGDAVACCLASTSGRLIPARANPQKAATALAAAGLIAAVGTSAGQILDEVARTGLQRTMWHGSTGMNELGAGGEFTFQFGWVAVAPGVVALAAVIARQYAPDTPATSSRDDTARRRGHLNRTRRTARTSEYCVVRRPAISRA
jgi:hypothetical protein